MRHRTSKVSENGFKSWVSGISFFFFFVAASSFPRANTSDSHSYKRFLKESVKFTLTNYLFVKGSLDSLILSRWIVQVFPEKELKEYVDQGYKYFYLHPDTSNPNFLRIVDEDYQLRSPLCRQKTSESEMDCLMLQAIWCDVVPPKKSILLSLQKISNKALASSDSDVASHILFVLHELRKKKCFNSSQTDLLLSQTRAFLLNYIDKNPRSYGEGVSMLLRTGFAKDVKAKWIASIQETVQKKLAKKCSIQTCASEPHDILLEIYALAQWYSMKGEH